MSMVFLGMALFSFSRGSFTNHAFIYSELVEYMKAAEVLAVL